MKVKHNTHSRREFLKKGMTGLTGAALLPSLCKGDAAVKEGKKKFIYRTLGRTGLKIQVVSMGGSGAGVTRAALDAGIIHVETANRYGAGRHETMLGEILKGRPRESFVIATKIIPYLDNRSGLPSERITPAEFRKDFRKKMEQSLKRLQLEYVDILYLHGVETPVTLKDPLIKDIMLELKEESKTRFLGTSFHHNELKLIPATVDEKIYDVLLTSYNFRQPHREEVKKAIAYAAKAGVGTVAMKVMAGAYWDKEHKHPINGKAALKWLLQDTNLHSTIPSAGTFDQLEENLSVMEDLTLTPKERADLRFGEQHTLAGLYCAQCGRCRGQCRYQLEIPTIMRSYMYAYGYRKPAKARETLADKKREHVTCRSCTTCKVSCTMNFNVPEKIKDITRILDVPKDFLI